jgi:hypothetical protein
LAFKGILTRKTNTYQPFAPDTLKKKNFTDRCSPETLEKTENYCKQKNIKGKLTEADAIALLQFMDTQ